MTKKVYYDIADDIENYPEAWCYIVVGGRGTGKTYSALKREYVTMQEPFAFVKRTNDDVKIMCGSSKNVEMDLSPFKPINRDFVTNVKATLIQKGIGGFYNTNDEGEVTGSPVGYITSMNAIGNIKGFDLSDCEVMIFDEFIPNIYERVNKKEGEQILDLYKTISRDRELRGRKPLKLIALANATRVYNPLFEILEVIDIVVQMKANGEVVYYNNGIFIRLLDDNADFKKAESNTAIMKSLSHTSWGKMALDNEFAYDDFTHVGYTSLKGYKCLYGFSYKRKKCYVYVKRGKYYVCDSEDKTVKFYDLNIETQQALFYDEQGYKLRNQTIDGNVLYSSYLPYYWIMNFRKYFIL